MIRTAREEAVKFCWFRHSNERVTPEEPGKTKEKSCRSAQVYVTVHLQNVLLSDWSSQIFANLTGG